MGGMGATPLSLEEGELRCGRTNCAETGVFQHGDENKGNLAEEQSGGWEGKAQRTGL